MLPKYIAQNGGGGTSFLFVYNKMVRQLVIFRVVLPVKSRGAFSQNSCVFKTSM